jgi:predicted N-formylglutamate amidohydrolase
MREQRTSAPSMADAADSPAFRLINAKGRANLLLVCDHASNRLPAGYDALGLDPADLWRHIAYDIGAADVTERLARLLDAPAILSSFSRLLIDCNRAPEDPTLICDASDGTVVPNNRGIDARERRRRLRLYFEPYHQAIARRLAAFGPRAKVFFAAVHSFTPVLKGKVRPWHVGILWNRDPRLAKPLLAGLRRDPNIKVGDNEPYDGRGNVGYTMRRHAEPAKWPHALIEIRQDLIDTHHGAEEWAKRIAAALEFALA